jgi:hypothetical protein
MIFLREESTYYKSDNEERPKEIKQRLINNFNNKYIDKIYLLNDKIYDLSFIEGYQYKIIQYVVDNDNKKRLGFDYAINYINNNFKDIITILSNSDIYFDETLKELVNYDFEKKFLAISRYNNNILYNKASSQDTWIFKPKVNINLSDCDFKFDILGCDNRIAYIFMKAGYKVLNPSKTIKTYHLHNSNFRTNKEIKQLKGWFYFIEPSELYDKPMGNIIFNEPDYK